MIHRLKKSCLYEQKYVIINCISNIQVILRVIPYVSNFQRLCVCNNTTCSHTVIVQWRHTACPWPWRRLQGDHMTHRHCPWINWPLGRANNTAHHEERRRLPLCGDRFSTTAVNPTKHPAISSSVKTKWSTLSSVYFHSAGRNCIGETSYISTHYFGLFTFWAALAYMFVRKFKYSATHWL